MKEKRLGHLSTHPPHTGDGRPGDNTLPLLGYPDGASPGLQRQPSNENSESNTEPLAQAAVSTQGPAHPAAARAAGGQRGGTCMGLCSVPSPGLQDEGPGGRGKGWNHVPLTRHGDRGGVGFLGIPSGSGGHWG